MSEVFPLFFGTFSDIMEKPDLDFSFGEVRFLIVFSFSILSVWILSGIFSLLDDLLIPDLTLDFCLHFHLQ